MALAGVVAGAAGLGVEREHAVIREGRVARPVGGQPHQHEVGIGAAGAHLAAAHYQTIVGVAIQAPGAVGGEAVAVYHTGAQIEDHHAIGAEGGVLAPVGVEPQEGNVAIARIGRPGVLHRPRHHDLARRLHDDAAQ